MEDKGTYWYKVYTTVCVCCGRENVEKERVYGPKPDDPAERYEYIEELCYGCLM